MFTCALAFNCTLVDCTVFASLCSRAVLTSLTVNTPTIHRNIFIPRFRASLRGSREIAVAQRLRRGLVSPGPLPFWPCVPRDHYGSGLVALKASWILVLGATRTLLLALWRTGPGSFWLCVPHGQNEPPRLRRQEATSVPAVMQSDSQRRMTRAVAIAAMPSPRPVRPKPSVVVAERETGAPERASLSTAAASARRFPILGRLPIT